MTGTNSTNICRMWIPLTLLLLNNYMRGVPHSRWDSINFRVQCSLSSSTSTSTSVDISVALRAYHLQTQLTQSADEIMEH